MEMTTKNIFHIVVLVIVLLFMAGIVGKLSFEADGIETVPIQNIFPGKIVYSTDSDLNQGVFIAHCESQGGVFNPCGSVCPFDAEVCIDVCAYTCEFSGNNTP